MMRRIVRLLFRTINNTGSANAQSEEIETKKTHDVFHLEEYKQIRAEVVSLLARLDTVLQYAVIGSALVYSWIVVQGFGVLNRSALPCLKLPSEVVRIGLWIPLALVFIMGLFALTTWLRICEMGQYLKRLEIRLGKTTEPDCLGWEHRKRSTGAFPLTAFAWAALTISVAYATYDVRCMTTRAGVSCSMLPSQMIPISQGSGVLR